VADVGDKYVLLADVCHVCARAICDTHTTQMSLVPTPPARMHCAHCDVTYRVPDARDKTARADSAFAYGGTLRLYKVCWSVCV
jgi:hypothetical protein